jgi:hypothetical protein
MSRRRGVNKACSIGHLVTVDAKVIDDNIFTFLAVSAKACTPSRALVCRSRPHPRQNGYACEMLQNVVDDVLAAAVAACKVP